MNQDHLTRHAKGSASAVRDLPDAIPARWPLIFVATMPRHLLSRLGGSLVRIRWPGFLQRILNGLFVWLFGVDASESEQPIADYKSIQDLFTRQLKAGSRPIEGTDQTLVAPADGAMGACGVAGEDRAIQAKGRSYSVTSLLGGGTRAQKYIGGSYATFYLSPRDYHWFHTPAAGRVCCARYLPGALWPVNKRAVAHIDDLFARNERLVTFIETQYGEIAVVAVGATMVGRVVVTFDEELTTNVSDGQMLERDYAKGKKYKKGAQLGRFEFGSTIIVVLPHAAGHFNSLTLGAPCRVGQAVGLWSQESS